MEFVTASKLLQNEWEVGQRHHPVIIQIDSQYHLFLHLQFSKEPAYMFVGSVSMKDDQLAKPHPIHLIMNEEKFQEYNFDLMLIDRNQLMDGQWRDSLWLDADYAGKHSFKFWTSVCPPVVVLSILRHFFLGMSTGDIRILYQLIRGMAGYVPHPDGLNVEALSMLPAFEYCNAALVYAKLDIPCV